MAKTFKAKTMTIYKIIQAVVLITLYITFIVQTSIIVYKNNKTGYQPTAFETYLLIQTCFLILIFFTK